jgi:Do/DeqQ family serine protease
MRVSYADVVEKTSSAVVQIEAEIPTSSSPNQFPFVGDEFFKRLFPQGNGGEPRVQRGAGSGVLVGSDGTILTNHHVIDGATKIQVKFQNGESHEAKIVGSDAPSDLAVLKIEGDDFPFMDLGDSDQVRIGDIVLAIGNPLGIGQTVTAGIISAKGRRTGISDGTFEDFLQTDAPINRGNSGGALVNLSGELIGINSQIISPSGGSIGIGFAIPSNMAKNVMTQLVDNGKVRRGRLGVMMEDVNAEIAKRLGLSKQIGALVRTVSTPSAASKAGIKEGDVIVAVDGERMESGNALRNKIAATLPGTTVKITVIRNGSEVELNARLEEAVEGR